MVNLKMIIKELLVVANLLGAQTFCIYKAKKVVIMLENKHLMLAIF